MNAKKFCRKKFSRKSIGCLIGFGGKNRKPCTDVHEKMVLEGNNFQGDVAATYKKSLSKGIVYSLRNVITIGHSGTPFWII